MHNPSSAARPSQRLMITLCARRMGERTTAALAPHGPCPLACRAHESLRRGEFFGTYLAQLPDLVALRPLGSGRLDRVFSHPGWSPGILPSAARPALRPRRPPRRCPAPLPHVARPGSCTGLDLRFLVAGPGFEPGKTVVGDFTDPARYCPDLGGHQSNAPLWHAFDMTTRHASHSSPPVRSPDRPTAVRLVCRRLTGSVCQSRG